MRGRRSRLVGRIRLSRNDFAGRAVGMPDVNAYGVCPMPATVSTADLQGCKVMVVEDEPSRRSIIATGWRKRVRRSSVHFGWYRKRSTWSASSPSMSPCSITHSPIRTARSCRRHLRPATFRSSCSRAIRVSSCAAKDGAVEAHLGRSPLHDHQGCGEEHPLIDQEPKTRWLTAVYSSRLLATVMTR
jgi:hypothetical protein